MFMFLCVLATGYIHQPFGGKDEPSIMITAGAAMQLAAFILLFLAPREDGADMKKEPRRAPADFGLLMIYVRRSVRTGVCARLLVPRHVA